MTRQLLIGLGIGLMLIGCRAPRGDDRGVVGELPPESFARQWAADLQLAQDPPRQMHVREELVFVYTRNNNSYVLDRAAGRLLHISNVAPPDGRVEGPVLLSDRIVYPTTTTLEVFDMRGRPDRTISLRNPSRSGAVGEGREIYVGQDYPRGGHLVAINLDRPYSEVRWEVLTMGGISSTPAIYGGVIYAAGEDGRVWAITRDRSPHWPLEGGTFQTGGRVVADVMADDFGVYIASGDSRLYCLDRNTGRIRWQYFAGRSLDTAPIVTRDSVYQFVTGTGLVALEKTTGAYNRQARWTAPRVRQFLAEDARFVYARRDDNTIVALERQSGEERFRSERRDFRVFGINTYDSIIYAATGRGELLAIRPVLRAGDVGERVLRDEGPDGQHEEVVVLYATGE